MTAPLLSPLRPAEPYKSELAAAIEATERPCAIYPVGGFFGLGQKPIRKVAFRVNVKSEEDRALVQAHLYVTNLAAGAETAKHDGDLRSDAKARHALFEACREVVTKRAADGTETDEVTKYPAFPGPEWMAEHLTTDQIASLLNLYNQTRAEQAGWLDDLSDDSVEDMISVAVESANRNPIARAGLAEMPREHIVFLLERAAIKLQAARADLEMLSKIDSAKEAATPST